MFDDFEDKKNANTGQTNSQDSLSSSPSSFSAQTPPSVPNSSYKSPMSAGVVEGNNFAKGVPDAGMAEDMFLETDKIEKPAIFQPKKIGDTSSINEPTDANQNKKKVFILLMSVIGVVVVGVGVFLAYYFFVSVKNAPVNEENNSDSSILPEDNSETSDAVADSAKDTDKDGLTDNEEMSYATDIYKVDSDDDGLSDILEIRTYGTDPINTDSDHDGAFDGEEINKGLNPNGPGFLYKSGNINIDLSEIDTDEDGISDKDEVELRNTDLNNPDTDGDGLTDGDEVLKYGTSPTSVDTDGDSYGDGDEIKGGYNPRGKGKIGE